MSDAPAGPVPFTSLTDPAALEDLRARLRATRWPDAPQDAGWSLGTDVDYLRDLVTYWADGFDWPACEAELNRLPRYRITLGNAPADGPGSRPADERVPGPEHGLSGAPIDEPGGGLGGGVGGGLGSALGGAIGVHFVHAKAASGGGVGMPLVLCHGWPDSFWRYTKVISLLTDPGAHGADPADAFDVVVPDMPGFGYSDRPTGPPLDSIAVAGLWAELMTTLGYPRFAAAGGDVGSHVSRYLALDHADRVIAVHRTDAGVPRYAGDPTDLAPEERAWLAAAATWGATEGAYAAMHSTKPQTAAVGLTDSPAGLAAWIVEKMTSWSDGGLEQAFTRDEILTNLTIYWLTGTIGSSMRMYRANSRIPPAQHARRVEVPSGFTLYPGEPLDPPRAWLERTTNLARVTEAPRGGHFAAFEEPEHYAAELRDFFRPFRDATPG